MRKRVFFPQAALDEWLGDGRVDLKNDELLIKSEGRRYRIIEATRILREVTNSDDPHEIIGKVKSRGFLNELGAEILEGSMIIGENAYDIVPGFVGAPIGSFADHQRTAPEVAPSRHLATDEELLASFLAEKL